jgi:hypothetical protein
MSKHLFEIPKDATDCMAVLIKGREEGTEVTSLCLKGREEGNVIDIIDEAAYLFAAFVSVVQSIKTIVDEEEHPKARLFMSCLESQFATLKKLQVVGEAMINHNRSVNHIMDSLHND